MRTLVWFRSDLRVGGNPALWHAARRGEVVGLYVVSAGDWERHDTSACRVEFVLRSLRELKERLREKGVALRMVWAERPRDVAALVVREAARWNCGGIAFNREYEWNEARRDEELERLARAAGIDVEAHHDQVLFAPGEVLTGQETYYTVFTPFRRAVYKRFEEEGVPGAAGTMRKQQGLGVEASEIPERVKGFESEVDAGLWPAGEREAQKRLEKFAEGRIRAYDRARDVVSEDGTSALSPYLAVGAVSVRQCLEAALSANDGRWEGGHRGVAAWVSELVWREFYRHIVVGFPRVCMHRPFRAATERIRWSENAEHVRAWQEGRTGYPIVDAGMRCLRETGWMHNRLRMIAAMFFTKDLFLDWRVGERHFMRNLIDGDLASNNGGWQWSASTGTDAAPYFRVFNPTSQSRKCDPEAAFIRRWVPELAGLDDKAIHEPSTASARAAIDYPEPIVDHGVARLRAIAAFKSALGPRRA